MRKTALTALVLLAPVGSAQAKLPTGGAGGAAPAPDLALADGEGGAAPAPDLALADGQLVNNGGPLPTRVQRVIAAANRIAHKPYIWGGGHARFRAPGYDCSGSVSYALHGGRFLRAPRTSGGLMTFGRAGRGRWITVYANSGHTYLTVGRFRFDTWGGRGPRWHRTSRSSAGFTVRHAM